MPSLNRTVANILVVSLCALGLPIPAAQAELVATDRIETARQGQSSAREFRSARDAELAARALLEARTPSVSEPIFAAAF